MIVSIVLVLGGMFIGALGICLLSPPSEYIDHDADNLLSYEIGYRRGQAEATSRWLRSQADFKGHHADSHEAYQAKHAMRINRIA